MILLLVGLKFAYQGKVEKYLKDTPNQYQPTFTTQKAPKFQRIDPPPIR